MSNGFEFRPTGDIVYHRQRGDQPPEEWWIYLPTIGERETIDLKGRELADRLTAMSEQMAPIRDLSDQLTTASKIDDQKAVKQLSAKLEKALAESDLSLGDFQQAMRDSSLEWFTFVVETVGAGWPDDRKEWPSMVRRSDLTRIVREHWDNVPLGVSGTV